MTLTEEVKKEIEEALEGSQVTVYDESQGHEEHNSEGAHLGVKVIYKGFTGLSMIEQHQLIYKILDNKLKNKQIHALRIKTLENE